MQVNVNGTDSFSIANEFNNFFITSVEELAENFEPATLTPAIKHEPSKLFQIKEVSQKNDTKSSTS